MLLQSMLWSHDLERGTSGQEIRSMLLQSMLWSGLEEEGRTGYIQMDTCLNVEYSMATGDVKRENFNSHWM